MFYLIYISSAVKLMENEELCSLLEESREKNANLGVTGMLLYKGGNFMQMLEGEEGVVRDLYATITDDIRHTNVITILTGESGNRIFQNWSMGFCNMDQSEGLPKIDEYLEQNLHFSAFEEDAQQAYRFIAMFHEKMR